MLGNVITLIKNEDNEQKVLNLLKKNKKLKPFKDNQSTLKNNTTPLIQAVTKGYFEVVKYLVNVLNVNPDENIKLPFISRDATALDFAVMLKAEAEGDLIKSYKDIIQFLIEKKKTKFETDQNDICNACNQSMERDDLDTFKLIIEKEPTLLLKISKFSGINLLHMAISFKAKDIIEYLLEPGLDGNPRNDMNIKNHEGFNCFHFALVKHNIEILNLFIKHGANIIAPFCENVPDPDLYELKQDCIQSLLAHGAGLNPAFLTTKIIKTIGLPNQKQPILVVGEHNGKQEFVFTVDELYNYWNNPDWKFEKQSIIKALGDPNIKDCEHIQQLRKLLLITENNPSSDNQNNIIVADLIMDNPANLSQNSLQLRINNLLNNHLKSQFVQLKKHLNLYENNKSHEVTQQLENYFNIIDQILHGFIYLESANIKRLMLYKFSLNLNEAYNCYASLIASKHDIDSYLLVLHEHYKKISLKYLSDLKENQDLVLFITKSIINIGNQVAPFLVEQKQYKLIYQIANYSLKIDKDYLIRYNYENMITPSYRVDLQLQLIASSIGRKKYSEADYNFNCLAQLPTCEINQHSVRILNELLGLLNSQYSDQNTIVLKQLMTLLHTKFKVIEEASIHDLITKGNETLALYTTQYNTQIQYQCSMKANTLGKVVIENEGLTFTLDRIIENKRIHNFLKNNFNVKIQSEGNAFHFSKDLIVSNKFMSKFNFLCKLISELKLIEAKNNEFKCVGDLTNQIANTSIKEELISKKEKKKTRGTPTQNKENSQSSSDEQINENANASPVPGFMPLIGITSSAHKNVNMYMTMPNDNDEFLPFFKLVRNDKGALTIPSVAPYGKNQHGIKIYGDFARVKIGGTLRATGHAVEIEGKKCFVIDEITTKKAENRNSYT